MNINVSIIDQQTRGVAERLRSRIEDALERSVDDTMARSVAFLILVAKVLLDRPEDEVVELLTEGGNDFGVDAIDVSDVVDGEFTVTLLQGKYHHENLEGTKAFPQSGVEKAIQAVRHLFDPAIALSLNRRLEARIEEVRSLIVDGFIPNVRVILCSNGQPWKNPEAQALIDHARFPDRMRFEHVNHDLLIRILQSSAAVQDTLQFVGKAIVEDFNYTRVFLGKIAVSELARLMDAHGDRLLERNIRRYLGLSGNRVNEAIRSTLGREDDRQNFYFYNNGVTLICSRFDYNALQSENHKVRVEGLQIINGGQTSKTVQTTLTGLSSAQKNLDTAFVLVRLYQVPSGAGSFVQNITFATNSQNPVDLRDLRSNDEVQRQLALSIKGLGFEYRRQRAEGALRPTEFSAATAAEAVLSVWRERPQQAKFRTSDHFGKLYNDIFTADLTAAQVVTAVLLFRIAENRRRRPAEGAPDLVRYASCFAAMLMGRYLLHDLGVPLGDLDHRRFDDARRLIEANGDGYYERAVAALESALTTLYGNQQVSLQRLSATFRRGDLVPLLTKER